MPACKDCVALCDEVSNKTIELKELRKEHRSIESTMGKLISHLIENNLMSPEEFMEIGIMVAPMGKDPSELIAMMKKIMGNNEGCGKPDCEACNPKMH